MRKLVTAVVVAMAAVAMAIPPKKDLAAAQKLIDELMAEDLAAFKAGKKTAVQIAETEQDLAEKADTDAAKYLLGRDAVLRFSSGAEYDRAAAVLDGMSELKDVSEEDLLGLAKTALKKARRGEGGTLAVRKNELLAQVKAKKTVAELTARLRKDPENSALRLRLAEAQVAVDAWDKALESFAKLIDKVGAVARWELEKKGDLDAYKVGEFWKDYAEEKKEPLDRPYRAHAAQWYREALSLDLVSGLRRELVEKWLEKQPVDPGRFKKDPVVDIGNGERLEFVQCPAGSFTMGGQEGRKVNSSSMMSRSHDRFGLLRFQ